MLDVVFSNRFKKDLRLAKKRGYNLDLLNDVVVKPQKRETLPPKNHDHDLTGDYTGFRECHIFVNGIMIRIIRQIIAQHGVIAYYHCCLYRYHPLCRTFEQHYFFKQFTSVFQLTICVPLPRPVSSISEPIPLSPPHNG